jgi:hypothetical protein
MRGTFALVCVTALRLGCGPASGPPGSNAPGAAAVGNPDAERLARIADDYYERWLELNPLEATAQGDHRFDANFGDYASPPWLADSLAAEQDALEQLRGVNPDRLDRRGSRHLRGVRTAATSRSKAFAIERAAGDQPVLEPCDAVRDAGLGQRRASVRDA